MSSNLGFGFSVNQEDVKDSGGGLPDGAYPLKVIEAERKVSGNDPSSWYVKATFEVLSGPAAGRRHFQNYNVGNAKQDVRDMSLSELKRFASAIGYTGPLNDFAPFINKPFVGTIKNTPRKDKPDEMNTNIRKYESASTYSGAPVVNVAPPITAVAAPAATLAANSAPAAGGAAPWGAQKAA